MLAEYGPMEPQSGLGVNGVLTFASGSSSVTDGSALERSRALYELVAAGKVSLAAVLAFPVDWANILEKSQRQQRNGATQAHVATQSDTKMQICTSQKCTEEASGSKSLRMTTSAVASTVVKNKNGKAIKRAKRRRVDVGTVHFETNSAQVRNVKSAELTHGQASDSMAGPSWATSSAKMDAMVGRRVSITSLTLTQASTGQGEAGFGARRLSLTVSTSTMNQVQAPSTFGDWNMSDASQVIRSSVVLSSQSLTVSTMETSTQRDSQLPLQIPRCSRFSNLTLLERRRRHWLASCTSPSSNSTGTLSRNQDSPTSSRDTQEVQDPSELALRSYSTWCSTQQDATLSAASTRSPSPEPLPHSVTAPASVEPSVGAEASKSFSAPEKALSDTLSPYDLVIKLPFSNFMARSPVSLIPTPERVATQLCSPALVV